MRAQKRSLLLLLLLLLPALVRASEPVPAVRKVLAEGSRLWDARRYAEAHTYYAANLRRLEAAQPPIPQVDLALVMQADGTVCHLIGKFAEAEALFRRCIPIFRQEQPPDTFRIIGITHRLGMVFESTGRYAEGLELYRGLAVYAEGRVPPDSSSAILPLVYEGMFLWYLGRAREAEAALRRGVELTEKAGRERTMLQVVARVRLADALGDLGRFGEVEPMLTRALATVRELLGEGHPEVAPVLDALATHYQQIGKMERACETYRAARDILQKNFGTAHPEALAVANNLARADFAAGRTEQAMAEMKRILAVRRQQLGPTHDLIARSCAEMGQNYLVLARPADAIPFLQEAIACGKVIYAADSRRTAGWQLTLFDAEAAQGKQVDVKAYRETLACLQRALGPDNPNLLTPRLSLAFFLARQESYAAAWTELATAVDIDEQHQAEFLGYADESGAIDYLRARNWSRDALLCLALQHLGNDPGVMATAADSILRSKGQVQEGIARRRKLQAKNEAQAALAALGKCRETASRIALSDNADPTQLDQLQRQIESIESQLARQSPVFSAAVRDHGVRARDVQQALPTGTVVVEFVRPVWVDFSQFERAKRWLPARYVALVLRSDAPPVICDLGEAVAIDKLVADYRKTVLATAEASRGLRRLEPEQASRKQMETVTTALYAAVFAPLEAAIGDAKRLRLSPAGDLNLVPFEALHAPGGEYLAARFVTSYLSVARDVLAPEFERGHVGESVIVGNPAYDATLPGLSAPEVAMRSADLKDAHFTPLPGTGTEAAAVSALFARHDWAATTLTGDAATEERLKQVRAPRVLHLATHGYFLPGPELNDAERQGQLRLGGRHPDMDENPLLRSGLALAGANRRHLAQGEDGILTGLEVCNLALQGTELVCLSACETGLGEVRFGEGVFGLRRAFQQAGAQSLITSMWVVSDRETVDLMTRFYERWVTDQPLADALQQARLEMIARLRRERGYAHPFVWAPFVLIESR